MMACPLRTYPDISEPAWQALYEPSGANAILNARRGEEKVSSPRLALRAPREISCSPRLAHKAPVMQARYFFQEITAFQLAVREENSTVRLCQAPSLLRISMCFVSWLSCEFEIEINFL